MNEMQWRDSQRRAESVGDWTRQSRGSWRSGTIGSRSGL